MTAPSGHDHSREAKAERGEGRTCVWDGSRPDLQDEIIGRTRARPSPRPLVGARRNPVKAKDAPEKVIDPLKFKPSEPCGNARC